MNSTQYATPERQLGDVVGVQSGVEDRSAATKASGLAQAVGQVGGASLDIYGAVQQKQADEATAAATAQYEELLKQEEAYRERGVSSSKLRAWRIEKEKEIAPYISFEDRLSLRSKYDKAFGGVLTEETFEDREEKLIEETALKINVDPRTEVGREAVAEYRRAEANAGQDAQKLATGLLPVVYAQADAVVNNNSMTYEQKKMQLEILRNQVAQDTMSLRGDKEYRDSIIRQYDGILNTFLETIDPAKQADKAANLNRLTLERNKAAALSVVGPSGKTLVAIDSLFPNGSAALFKQQFVKGAPDFYNNIHSAITELSKGNFNPTTQTGGDALQVIDIAADEAVKSGSPVEGLDNSLVTIQEETALRLPSASPDSVKSYIESMAGQAGTYYKNNIDRIPPETRQKAEGALVGHFNDKVRPLVAKAFEEKLGSGIGRRAVANRKTAVERQDSIQITSFGDMLVFTTTDPSARENVKSLNEDISSDLSLYARALSNVTGATLEETGAQLRDYLFDQMTPAEAETEETAEAVAPVSQEGVAQGMAVADDEQVMLEKQLDERVLSEAKGTKYEEDYKALNAQLDAVKDPSLRYVLKKRYSDLLLDINPGVSTGGRSRKVGKTSPKAEGTTKFTESQMQLGSQLLGEVPDDVAQETKVPTLGDAMFSEIAEVEGSGSNISGDVPTAHYGVTAAAAKAVGAEFDKDMSREQAKEISIAYINLLDSKFESKISNWNDLPEGIRKMAVDTAYNVGEKVLSYKGFIGDLKAGKTADQVAINILDTANAGGKSMRGLAVRRAEAYNKVAANKISAVEQKRSGEIIYYDSEDRIIFSYKPSGGKHPDSKAEKEYL